jgi:hypothetical protein
MSEIATIKRSDDAQPPTVISDDEVKRLALRYRVRMAQIRGLIAIHGREVSKLNAAVKRLQRQPN